MPTVELKTAASMLGTGDEVKKTNFVNEQKKKKKKKMKRKTKLRTRTSGEEPGTSADGRLVPELRLVPTPQCGRARGYGNDASACPPQPNMRRAHDGRPRERRCGKGKYEYLSVF
jgi:hypothetical protein